METENEKHLPVGGEALVVPLNLWLQWHGDGDPDDTGEVAESEVTWCREKIFTRDVEYVHSDEIRRALMGHRRSELWGDKGLIAATMRCVDAIGLIEDLVTTNHETKEAFIKRVRGILGHVKEHAPLSAGASVDHGVEVETTADHLNRAADRGCCVSSCSPLEFSSGIADVSGTSSLPEQDEKTAWMDRTIQEARNRAARSEATPLDRSPVVEGLIESALQRMVTDRPLQPTAKTPLL